MAYYFEIGPIRPPSEAQSLLIRVTRNCPWNKCEFCTTYKAETFSFRSLEEIKRDIDSVKEIYDEIRKISLTLSGKTGNFYDQIIDRRRTADEEAAPRPEGLPRILGGWRLPRSRRPRPKPSDQDAPGILSHHPVSGLG